MALWGSFLAPMEQNEGFYRENVLKTIRGPYNVRKTFQAIRASVLERFQGVSPRFLLFFLHFLQKSSIWAILGSLGNSPKHIYWGDPPLTGKMKIFC